MLSLPNLGSQAQWFFHEVTSTYLAFISNQGNIVLLHLCLHYPNSQLVHGSEVEKGSYSLGCFRLQQMTSRAQVCSLCLLCYHPSISNVPLSVIHGCHSCQHHITWMHPEQEGWGKGQKEFPLRRFPRRPQVTLPYSLFTRTESHVHSRPVTGRETWKHHDSLVQFNWVMLSHSELGI